MTLVLRREQLHEKLSNLASENANAFDKELELIRELGPEALLKLSQYYGCSLGEFSVWLCSLVEQSLSKRERNKILKSLN